MVACSGDYAVDEAAKGLSALHRILGGTADLDSLLDSEVAA